MIHIFPMAQNLSNCRNLQLWKIYISILKKRLKKSYGGIGVRNYVLFLNYIFYIGKWTSTLNYKRVIFLNSEIKGKHKL